MTVGCLIQARLGSTRLPGKVLTDLLPGWPMLDVIIARARRATCIDGLLVATSDAPGDDPIAEHCTARGIPCFRGSESDVLARLAGAAAEAGYGLVLRLTSDNPLIDGALIDDLVAFHRAGGYDYSATTMMGHSELWSAERTFPRGVSLEVLGATLLAERDRVATDPLEREHATVGIYDRTDGAYRLGAFQAEGPYADWRHPELRLTVDTPEDLELSRRLFAALGSGGPASFSTGEAIRLAAGDPELWGINAGVRHNVLSQLRPRE